MTKQPHGNDPFDLDRFVEAQQRTFEQACGELRAGRKRSHWIWYIFPQMQGLGSSSMAQHYAISSLDEAMAYLAHPVLGPRLEQATRHMIGHQGKPLSVILGSPDDMKFRSSMTLFAVAAGPDSIFAVALDRLCGGERDALTLELLGRRSQPNG